MKIILVLMNLLLAGLVLWGGVHFFKNLTFGPKPAAFTVKKREPSARTTPVKSQATVVPKNVPVRTASGEAAVKRIVELDIFNQERCPNSGVWGGGNARVEMTLVGTFTIGKTKGAVILQKAQNRNTMFTPFGGMMNPGGMQGVRRQGIGRGSGGMGMGEMNQRTNGGGFRRQIGGNRSMTMNRNAQGIVQPGQNTNTAQPVYKQYVRLGETLANGYKLAEVSRTRVTLTRGSDKLELELSDASQNAAKNAAGRKNSGRPATQTQLMQQMLQNMQNMQRAQMMQGFQMMQMNRQNMQNMQNMQNSGRSGTAPRRR